MSFLSLRQWLWQGTFEPVGPRLAYWTEEGKTNVGRQDLLQYASQLVARLELQTEQAREREQQTRRALAMAGKSTGAPGEDAPDMQAHARQMLASLDALDRLLEYGRKSELRNPEFDNWLTAIEGLGVRLGRTMEKIGLTAVSTLGAEVDLAIHDVVATVKTRDYPENTIIEERQKGYYFKGRLIRDAKVVVAIS